jgi:hypothetical protein
MEITKEEMLSRMRDSMELADAILCLLDGGSLPEITFALAHAVAVVSSDSNLELKKMFDLMVELQKAYESQTQSEVH